MCCWGGDDGAADVVCGDWGRPREGFGPGLFVGCYGGGVDEEEVLRWRGGWWGGVGAEGYARC